MKKSFCKPTAFLLTAALLVSAAGCSTPAAKSPSASAASDTGVSSQAESASAGGTLRYNIKAELDTLDPQMANSADSNTVCFHIFDGLMRNDNGKIEPGAATDYDVSEDGLTYTFHLREGQKWSDGKELTAQDFVYAWKRLVDPKTASPYAYYGAVVKNGADITAGKTPVDEFGVEASDDYTFVVTLENPAAYFPYMLSSASFAPSREDLVEKYGKDFAASPDKNAYNGPFTIKSWEHGNKLTLEKNPNYWDASAIKLDQVEISVVTDGKTALAMYNQGQLDLVNVPQEMVEQYKDKATPYYNGADDYLAINEESKNKALSNKNFRLALNYGIDRSAYIKLATSGVYSVNSRGVLPQVAGYDNGVYGEQFPYEAFPAAGDMAKAKDYLDKALRELGAAKASDITVELLTTDTDTSKKQAEVIQSQYKTNLGINVTIKQVAYKQRLDMESKKDFEMVFTGWMPDYSDPETYLNMWESDSAYNHISYSDPQFDSLMKAAETETDAKKRMEKLFSAEKVLMGDGALVPLQFRQEYMLENPKLKDFRTYFVGYTYNFVHAGMEG